MVPLLQPVVTWRDATARGGPLTMAQLDTIIADESKHRDKLRQMLARWP
jgi:hypothetical protein